jgi:hypothetical protein
MLAIIQLSLRLLAFRRLRPVAFSMARRASARNSKKSIETASDASLADLGVWYSIKVHGSLIKQERKHSKMDVIVGRSFPERVPEGTLDAFALLGTLGHGKGSLGAGGVVADVDALKGERISFERSSVERFYQRWLAHCVGVCLRGAEKRTCKCKTQSHLSVERGGRSAVAKRRSADGRDVCCMSTAVNWRRGRLLLAGRRQSETGAVGRDQEVSRPIWRCGTFAELRVSRLRSRARSE